MILYLIENILEHTFVVSADRERSLSADIRIIGETLSVLVPLS